MKKNLPLFLLFGFLSACTSVAHLKTDNSDTVANKTSASEIKVFVSDKNMTTNYDILGEVVVAADAGTNAESVVNKLRVQAAELGADTIVNLRLEFEYGYLSVAIKATGTAIKSK